MGSVALEFRNPQKVPEEVKRSQRPGSQRGGCGNKGRRGPGCGADAARVACCPGTKDSRPEGLRKCSEVCGTSSNHFPRARPLRPEIRALAGFTSVSRNAARFSRVPSGKTQAGNGIPRSAYPSHSASSPKNTHAGRQRPHGSCRVACGRWHALYGPTTMCWFSSPNRSPSRRLRCVNVHLEHSALKCPVSQGPRPRARLPVNGGRPRLTLHVDF